MCSISDIVVQDHLSYKIILRENYIYNLRYVPNEYVFTALDLSPGYVALYVAIHVGEGISTDVPTLVIDIHRLVRGKDGGTFT